MRSFSEMKTVHDTWTYKFLQWVIYFSMQCFTSLIVFYDLLIWLFIWLWVSCHHGFYLSLISSTFVLGRIGMYTKYSESHSIASRPLLLKICEINAKQLGVFTAEYLHYVFAYSTIIRSPSHTYSSAMQCNNFTA